MSTVDSVVPAELQAKIEKLEKDLDQADTVIMNQAAYISKQRNQIEEMKKIPESNMEQVTAVLEEMRPTIWWKVWLSIGGDFSTISTDDDECAVVVQADSIHDAILLAKLTASATDSFYGEQEVLPDQYVLHKAVRIQVVNMYLD